MATEASPALIALAAVVRERRTERRLSQEGLPNLHRNVVGGIERADREPSLSLLLRVAHALDWSGAELMAAVEARMQDLPGS